MKKIILLTAAVFAMTGMHGAMAGDPVSAGGGSCPAKLTHAEVQSLIDGAVVKAFKLPDGAAEGIKKWFPTGKLNPMRFADFHTTGQSKAMDGTLQCNYAINKNILGKNTNFSIISIAGPVMADDVGGEE